MFFNVNKFFVFCNVFLFVIYWNLKNLCVLFILNPWKYVFFTIKPQVTIFFTSHASIESPTRKNHYFLPRFSIFKSFKCMECLLNSASLAVINLHGVVVIPEKKFHTQYLKHDTSEVWRMLGIWCLQIFVINVVWFFTWSQQHFV